MKDNYLVLKDQNGKKKNCRILLDIEDNNKDVNYVVYTDEARNDDGSVKAYACTYVLSDKGNMTKLKQVETKEEYDFLDDLLKSLEDKKDEEY